MIKWVLIGTEVKVHIHVTAIQKTILSKVTQTYDVGPIIPAQ